MQAKRIGISPRKVRIIANLVRGLKVNEAQRQLTFAKREAAAVIMKLLNSAIADAEHNFNLNKDDLLISSITVNEGPTIHRIRPRAFGRSAAIRKRMSHIALKLTNTDSKTKKEL